ncbi:hypothetical protein VOI00_001875 [Clostridium perfringens]
MINKLFLDLNNFKSNLGSVERGDSIELNIKLLDSEDYSRSKFRVLGTKGDGKYVEQIEGINLEEKDLKVILEDQFVNCEGIVKLELNVVSVETEITTKEFYFFVSNTMNASIIDSADSLPTLEKVSKYVDYAVDNLEALKGASEDITIINSEFKENEIKRKANEMLREKNEKARVNSESIRVTGEEERETNELERIQAENDRKVSESNRKLSENTRKTNEAARVEAELNRQSLFEENEEIRNENENLRIASEKERIKFNSEAKTDELNRKESEKNRVLAEEERKSAEEARVSAEAIRQNTYTDFNDSEVERKNNEIKRQEAEALRVEAETRRDNIFAEKEEERNTSFIESEKVRNAAFNKAQDSRNTAFEESETIREEAFKISEKVRNDAEELRITAESERAKAEKLRVDSEKARVLAEEERNTTFTQKEEERNNTFTQNETNRNETFEVAEEARTVAETSRIESESSRVEAEKLRVTAETERVETENLRVTAEEERVAAEQIREEKFAGFESKISANTKELEGARTATTGEQFNSLDERIDCEVDRLNKKIEVSMLQQEDKESHVVENTVEGMTTDMIIKGRTLQNLFNQEGYYINPNGSQQYFHSRKYKNLFKAGKYTLKNITGKALIWDISRTSDDTWIKSIKANKSVVIDLQEGQYVRNIQALTENGWVLDGNIKELLKNNVIVLEGDKLNIIDTVEYFEGIKSFGEQEDKISILSHNKNFINLSDISTNHNSVTFKKENDSITIEGESNSINWGCVEVRQFLKKGTYFFNYQATGNGYIRALVYDAETLKSISSDIYPNIGREFINDKNRKILIRLFLKGESADSKLINKYWDIQLEEGTQATTYKSPKEDKKDILLSEYGFDEGLRGLNNSVYDELNDIKDVAIKRIEKLLINDINISEIQDRPNAPNTNWFQTDYISNTSIKTGGLNINNKLIGVTEGQAWADSNDFECLSITGTTSGARIKGRVNKGVTSEQLKERLKGLIIYYELAEPVETPLNESIALKIFNEKTYVNFENSIKGTSSFKAPVNTIATIARLNRENRALEEENKNLRQDFESTALVLTDSDLELVKQNVDMDFRLMEVEFALDIPQAILSSNIKFKNKKGEVKSMARTPYEMMKIVILSGDYDREDYMHKVGKYYERGRMTKEEHDELMSLMTADEVISK